MYKNNSRNGSNFKGCSPIQPFCGLKNLQSAVGYYSCTKRCASCYGDSATINRQRKTERK